MFLEDYLTMWHLKMLLAWIVGNSIVPWYVIWRNKRLRNFDVEEQFKPFVRRDIKEWSYLRVIFTHFFFVPRFSGCILCLIGALIVTKIICLGADVNNLGETRRKLILNSTCFWMRFFMLFFGVYNISYKRPTVDYSKWLGPDWKPVYDGATMYVCNH